MTCAKPVCIRFHKINGCTRVYHRIRYLTLLELGKYIAILKSIIINIIGVKRGITYVISHNYEEIKVDSYEYIFLNKSFYELCNSNDNK